MSVEPKSATGYLPRGERAMTTETRQMPALLTKAGEILEMDLLPISADAAGLLLPQVREVLTQVRRFEGYLADVVKSEMVERGQRERRAGETIYELIAESTWLVDDPGAMFALLTAAFSRDEITREELDRACQQVVTHHFDNRVLNVLAKRVPELDSLRRRVGGDPRLKVKS